MLDATQLQQGRCLEVLGNTHELPDWSLDVEYVFRESIHTKPPDFIERLIRALKDPMSYYAAALEPAAKNSLGKSVNRGRRGRKPNIALSVLIADCNRAYWTVIGENPQRPFEHQDKHGRLHQSPCVRLARQVHMKITGNPYPQTMERQARHARHITFQG